MPFNKNNCPYDPAEFRLQNAPEGEVTATFVQGVWGRATNLQCCFEGEDGTLFSVSTFHRNEYAPYEEGPSMRDAVEGETYKLTIGRSRNGNPTFLKAEKQ